jgi:hypothetical protein
VAGLFGFGFAGDKPAMRASERVKIPAVFDKGVFILFLHPIILSDANYVSWLPAGLLVIHRCSIFVKFPDGLFIKPIIPLTAIYKKHCYIAVFSISCL